MMVSKVNYPFLAELFRLVNYYKLPRKEYVLDQIVLLMDVVDGKTTVVDAVNIE